MSRLTISGTYLIAYSAGVALGFGWGEMLTRLSKHLDLYPEVQAWVAPLFDWLVLVPPLAATGLWLRGRYHLWALGPAAVGTWIGMLFTVMSFGMWGAHVFQGPPIRGLSLVQTTEVVRNLDPAAQTASDLNRKVSAALRTYVAGDQPSSREGVVSVRRVDADTWGAASLSPDGDCLLLLVTIGSTTGMESDVHYGRLPPGAPCTANQASNETVRSQQRGVWGCYHRDRGIVPGC